VGIGMVCRPFGEGTQVAQVHARQAVSAPAAPAQDHDGLLKSLGM
jgi:hypothetical protein